MTGYGFQTHHEGTPSCLETVCYFDNAPRVSRTLEPYGATLRLGLKCCLRDLPVYGSGLLRSPKSCQFAARVDLMSSRPARGIDGISGFDGNKGGYA
ncbi:unnamed protein product [Prunus armeniaca]